jgi:hypothetical protein
MLVTAAAGALGAYVAFIRPWHLRWGATDDEVACPLLGDSLIDKPRLQATHAVTVHAPPEAIWPWLVQMGQGRGGFYSYEGVERLLGLRAGNADRILPDLQELHAADELPVAPNGAGLPVDIVVPYRTLVMHSDSPIPARVAVMQAGYYRSVTWTFHLEPIDAENTRLIERWRADWEPTPMNTLVIRALLEPGAFIMERRMLLGIKARAEHAWAEQKRRAQREDTCS